MKPKIINKTGKVLTTKVMITLNKIQIASRN